MLRANIMPAIGILFGMALYALAGCVTQTPPETPRQKLAAAEVTYQGVVETVSALITQGTLIKGSKTAQRVADAVLSARIALDIWHQMPDSQDRQTAAIAALSALQQVLTEVQRGLQQ